jgi:hypothetical protein
MSSSTRHGWRSNKWPTPGVLFRKAPTPVVSAASPSAVVDCPVAASLAHLDHRVRPAHLRCLGLNIVVLEAVYEADLGHRKIARLRLLPPVVLAGAIMRQSVPTG